MNTIPTFEEWKERAEKISIGGEAFIDGKYVAAAAGERFDCISPLDGRVLASVASCDEEDVDRAVRAARRAFETDVWSGMAPVERKQILFRFAERIEEHSEELALLETLDMGKPIRYSLTHDLPTVVETIRWYAEAIDKVYDEIAPMGKDELGLVTREPLGVVGAVVPWNFPLDMAALKFAPALAAGNSVVLKPAEQSPLTAIRIGELAAAAGIPDGVFNVLPGFGPRAGKALGMHMDVDMIAFTGSTEVGKLFLRYAGESNMKQVALECGGKTPNIILADVPDADIAASEAAFGIFYNSGQVCTAPSRLLVDEKIYDIFLEKLLAAARAIKAGSPLAPTTEFGTLVDDVHKRRVLQYVEQGQQEGADLLLGGNSADFENAGCAIEPTIFENVEDTMVIAREEIFGPVLSVLKFDTHENALKIANNSHYGLQAAIWTRDLSTAHKFARALKVGMVTVNSLDSYKQVLPFGGVKQSGFGRDFSLHGLHKYTQLKSTYISL